MADSKISALPAAAAALATHEFIVNESGASKKVSGSQLSALFTAGLMQVTTRHGVTQADTGATWFQLIPDPDPGPSQSPPFEVLHERALFGATYDHVIKAGWNPRGLLTAFGRVWISFESNFETGNPTHPYSTEFHVSMSKAGGTEKRVFSAACERGADYTETALTTDLMNVYPTVGSTYFSWGATGMDFGSGFGLRKATNNQQWVSQRNVAGSAYIDMIKVNSADQVQVGTGQRAVLIDGPLSRGEVALSFAAALVVNCSQADQFRVAQMTSDMTIDLQGLLLGETKGRIYLRQAAAGGKKITAITASDTGRTLRMNVVMNPTTINTAAFLVADTPAVLTYEVTNVGGVAWCLVALEVFVAMGYA